LIKFASKLHRIAASEKILIAPLDWGLGHATRLVPIVLSALQAGHEVHLGVSGGAGTWLSRRFPLLQTHVLPSYAIAYLPSLSFVGNMRRQAWAIHGVQHREKQALQTLQKKIAFDKVISDNRYGLFHEDTENILLTHQIYPRASFLTQRLLRSYIHHRLRRFDQCWVPDFEPIDASLSGELSHGQAPPMPLRFIGPQSRFGWLQKSKPVYQKVILLSCPEPLRTAWENHLVATMQRAHEKIALITHGAHIGGEHQKTMGAIDVYYGLSDERICAILAASEEVICNAGYSTLMDMHAWGIVPAVFATPGQTEQEYLMHYLLSKNKVKQAPSHFTFS
jgi:hypothetical protein